MVKVLYCGLMCGVQERTEQNCVFRSEEKIFAELSAIYINNCCYLFYKARTRVT
jgi:hypothetical protein